MQSSSSQENIPDQHHVHRPGEWLPTDHRAHVSWLSGVIDHVDQNQKKPEDLHPVIQEFQKLIEENTRVYLLITSMFQQIPNKHPYNKDMSGQVAQIRDYKHLLQLLNHMMTTAPTWTHKAQRVHIVGLPINAMLDWPMGTPSGFAFFLDPDVNAMLKKVLNAWGKFLTSPESRYVLDDQSGWFSQEGHTLLTATANLGETNHKFEEMFVCDPSKDFYGFNSWDDFFTRTFREGIRPVASPEDDNVIANACESLTYNVSHNVKERDYFWVKGQPYSVCDMLAQDQLASEFVGGTVYQAFLSALSYHRWHAPVSGKIVKAYVKDGTYYSEPLFEGLGDPKAHEIDRAGQATGQGYITAVATRAIIFIEADNPKIGLMAVITVGMAEVSTCDITVKEGQHIKKGDQIGQFHFGGSTHCLLFRKGVNVTGFPEGKGREWNVPVRSKVAVVQ